MVLKRLLSSLPLALILAGAVPATLAAPSQAAKPAAFPDAFEDIDDVPLPDPDLWQRIRVGFRMEPLDSPRVHEAEDWYASRPDYIGRFVDRGSLYLHYIVGEVEKRGMPMEIALLPVVESAFNPHAYSRSKASGLWQFIPSTGKVYGLQQDWWKDNRRDVVAATDAALNYLERLYGMFNDWELALAAYNCGEGCVGRAIAANQKKGLPTDYLSLRLPPETQFYVPKLIAVKNIVLSPAAYGIELESVPDQAYFTAVQAPERIDVKLAAQLAGMTEEEFVALNPSHNGAVAVPRSGTILVPIDKAEAFRSNLEGWDKPLVTWTPIQGKRGESLDAIAKRNGVAAWQLRAANGAIRVNKKGRLVGNQSILVPMKGAQLARASSAPGRIAPVPAVNTVSVGAAPVRVANTGPKWYTVRPGDTLYGIALRFEAELEDLLDTNNLTSKSVIKPGLRLRLP